MGKRIIQQHRGHGSMTYRVRRKAFSIKPSYPSDIHEGDEFQVVALVNSGGHSAPIAKFKKIKGAGKTEVFHNFAAEGIYVGQKIVIEGHENGDIVMIGELKNTTLVFNIESKYKDGGKFIRSGGSSGEIINKKGNHVFVQMPSKKLKEFNHNCRATVGKVSGSGRTGKPILKAGKNYYIKKAKSKLYPRTSAVAMNAIDHPFGSGRGKRIKSKIAKRNSPPGRKVGLLRPSRTGRRKK